MILMAEATRMVMKSHSYFRTKMLYLTDNEYKHYNIKGYTVTNNKIDKVDIPASPSIKALRQQQKDEASKSIYIDVENCDIFTEFKNLSYFFVVPTIIYRDRYTLTPIRSMSNIILHSLNFLACIYYCTYISLTLSLHALHADLQTRHLKTISEVGCCDLCAYGY